jgi:hypothetical protein
LKNFTILFLLIFIFSCYSCKSTETVDNTIPGDVDKYNIMRKELGLIVLNKSWFKGTTVYKKNEINNKYPAATSYLVAKKEQWNVIDSNVWVLKLVFRDVNNVILSEYDLYYSGKKYKFPDPDNPTAFENFSVSYNYLLKRFSISYNGRDLEILQLFKKYKANAVDNGAIIETSDSLVVKEITTEIKKNWGIIIQ